MCDPYSVFCKWRSALYHRQDRTFRGTENMSKASPASAAAAAATPADSKARFVWEDPLLLEEQLSEEERIVREAARAYCQDKLMPRLLAAIRPATTKEEARAGPEWVSTRRPRRQSLAAEK